MNRKDQSGHRRAGRDPLTFGPGTPSPHVSVILPTFQRPHLIGRAIRSALSQTFRDFELLVVDDNCDHEKTESVIRSFTDARIRLIRQPGRGAVAAVNRGIAESRSPYLAFLDDDDEWLPEKLEAQIRIFQSEPLSTGVVYTGIWLIKNGESTYFPQHERVRKEGFIHRELLNRDLSVPLVAAMVRRECFATAGLFDECLPTSNDFEFWIRIARQFSFRFIPDPLVRVHFLPGSLSRDRKKIARAWMLLLDKYKDDFESVGLKTQATFCWELGKIFLEQGEVEQSRSYFQRALKIIVRMERRDG